MFLIVNALHPKQNIMWSPGIITSSMSINFFNVYHPPPGVGTCAEIVCASYTSIHAGVQLHGG